MKTHEMETKMEMVDMVKNLVSHRVERSEIVPGDHIYTYRYGKTYAHHGIYIGENVVIHFVQQIDGRSTSGIPGASDVISSSSGSPSRSFHLVSISSSYGSTCSHRISSSSQITPAANEGIPSPCSNFRECGFHKPGSGVLNSCLDCFLKKGSLRRYQYAVSQLEFTIKMRGGTCTIAKSDLPDEVICKAKYLLENGFGNYHLGKNNCEDFALYCKTGLMVPNKEGPATSGQINSLQALASSISVKALRKLRRKKKKLQEVVTWYSSGRYLCDIGVREDIMKVEVDKLSAFHSRREEEEDDDDDDDDDTNL